MKLEYKCPECGSHAVRVEVHTMFIQDPETGRLVLDDDAPEPSADGYAECAMGDCNHFGIVEEFES